MLCLALSTFHFNALQLMHRICMYIACIRVYLFRNVAIVDRQQNAICRLMDVTLVASVMCVSVSVFVVVVVVVCVHIM